MEIGKAAIKNAKSLNVFWEGKNNRIKLIFSIHRNIGRLKFLLNLRITKKIIKIRICLLQTIKEKNKTE